MALTLPRHVLLMLALALLAQVIATGSALADRLDAAHRRGVLIVGVKTDYPPFGFRDISGQLVGFEVDLARNIADRFGLQLELAGVTSANRLQKLEDGSVDLIIATLGDTAQRREIATIVEPAYYASGVTLLAPRNRKLEDWADARGQRICATQGALFNRAMSERYLLDLQLFNGTRDSKLALRDGRCIGWLYDDAAIHSDLNSPEWADHHMPLPPTMLTDWALALARSENGGPLHLQLGSIVADWHRSGFLVGLQKQWGLSPSAFLSEKQQLWSATDATGNPVCTRDSLGHWPVACRNQHLLTADQATGLHSLGLRLKELFGIDASFIYDPYDREHVVRGLLVTLGLVVACLAGSLGFGVAGAILADARIPVLSWLVVTAATFGRMTPPLLQMYVVFFGIGSVIVTWLGWTFDGFVVAALCLSLYAGSANVFALLEASEVLRRQDSNYRLRARTAGPALRLGYAALTASMVNIVKATGMASTIAVPELISASTSIIAERGNTTVIMNSLMVVYFLLVLLVVRLFSKIEARLVRP